MVSTTNNKRSKTSHDDSSDNNATQKMVLVPTCPNNENTEELDVQSMTEEELKLLQKKGKQSRRVVVAAVPISFIDSDDDPLSQSCSFLPTLLFMKQIRFCTTPFLQSVRLHSLSRKLTTPRYRSQRVMLHARREFHSRITRTS
jgi:hypothetical protein